MISLLMDRAEPCTWTLLTTSHCRVRCMYIMISVIDDTQCRSHIPLCVFEHQRTLWMLSLATLDVCNFGLSREALISTLTMFSSTAG